jgi:hypothetical protein
MTKVTYDAASPYFTTTQTRWYLAPVDLRSIPADSSDNEITVESKYQNRPDLLAYDLYGSPAYWWIFMVRNMDLIRDPIWDMRAGMKIMVPSSSRLTTILK